MILYNTQHICNGLLSVQGVPVARQQGELKTRSIVTEVLKGKATKQESIVC